MQDWSSWESYQLATSAIEGLCGEFKDAPEDFIVQEQPAYLPEGDGEHLYLWLEKRDVSASWLERQLERHLGVPRREIGVAGLKDRGAITRQWVSVPARLVAKQLGGSWEGVVGPLTDQITILEAKLHRNKLRRGHLRGNHFQIALRQLPQDLDDASINQRVERKLAWLAEHGMPNYFGPQRFGRQGNTLRLGLGLLRQDEQISRQISKDRLLKRLAANAVQSAHFNAVLASRLTRGDVHSPNVGDVLKKRDSGGIFCLQEHDYDDVVARVKGGELVITGPLYGPKMMRSEREIAALEQAHLEALGLQGDEFSLYDRLTPGERRPLLVWPEQLQWHLERELTQEAAAPERVLWLKFFLPSGSYATILVREVLSEMFHHTHERPAFDELDA